jgi:hypothetical protein
MKREYRKGAEARENFETTMSKLFRAPKWAEAEALVPASSFNQDEGAPGPSPLGTGAESLASPKPS